MCYFLVYVDDLLLTGSSSDFIQRFIAELAARFSLKEPQQLSLFLGIDVHHFSDGLFLSQHHYVRKILEQSGMDGAKPVSTPFATTTVLSKNTVPNHEVDSTLYRRLVGALQYLTWTRPDISFSVNKLSQFMQSPTAHHWDALKRLLRYLKSTYDYGVMIKPQSRFVFHAYSDANWAGDPTDRHSTTGYVVYFGDIPISWASKKQKTIARSSTEAEYRAVATTAAEVVWIGSLLQELGVTVSSPVIYCDNISATYACKNPVYHSKMKHIEIDIHFVRELIQQHKLRVAHVSTKDQLADLLTKPLAKTAFSANRFKIGVCRGPSILRGSVEAPNTDKS